MIIRQILGTTGTRVLHAASNLLLLWVATNGLGAEAWGVSGLILLDISLLMLLADIAGSALVYYSSRRNLARLYLLSAGFAMMIVVLASVVFWLMSFQPALYHYLVPEGYGLHILALTLINSLHGFSMYVLLGKGKMQAYNLLFVLQFLLLLAGLSFFIHIIGIHNEFAFVLALYLSYGVAAISGFLLIFNLIRNEKDELPHPTLSELLSFGSMTQLSSILHLLNKRLSFYALRHFTGLAALGVYHSGAQLTEGIRLVGQSVALVQLSNISKRNDAAFAVRLTLQLLKFSVVVTLMALLVLLLIPSSVFEVVFGRGFGEIRLVVISLSIGVLALAANAVFSHYFSGTGRPRYNLFASLAGFVVMVPAVFVLIPRMGLWGAGVSASAAYVVAVLYQWFVFKKESGVSLSSLRITKADMLEAKHWLLLLFKKGK